jgi:hypothetical protein
VKRLRPLAAAIIVLALLGLGSAALPGLLIATSPWVHARWWSWPTLVSFWREALLSAGSVALVLASVRHAWRCASYARSVHVDVDEHGDGFVAPDASGRDLKLDPPPELPHDHRDGARKARAKLAALLTDQAQRVERLRAKLAAGFAVLASLASGGAWIAVLDAGGVRCAVHVGDEAACQRVTSALRLGALTSARRFAAAAPLVGPGLPIEPWVTVAPIGGGACDDPHLQAVLNVCAGGKCNVRLATSTWTVCSQITIPSFTDVYLGGSTINTNAGGSAQMATFLAGALTAAAQQGVLLTLASTPAKGSQTISISSNPGLQVGDYIEFGDVTANAAQMIPMASIAGSGPFTITLGDGRFVAWSGVDVAFANNPAKRIRIHGEGAILNATAFQARGIELTSCHDCLVDDLTVTGPIGWGVAYDVGSFHSVLRNIRVIGPLLFVTGAANNGSGLIRLTIANMPTWLVTGTSIGVAELGGTTEANLTNWTITRIDSSHVDLQGSTFVHTYTGGGVVTILSDGIALESCESCRAENILVENVGTTNPGPWAGIYAYNNHHSVIDQATVTRCPGASGAVLDLRSLAFGSDSSTLSRSNFVGCQFGLQIADNGLHWKLDGLHIENPSSIGIDIYQNTGTPSGTTISHTEVIGSGNIGVLIQNGDDTSLIDTRISNSVGVALQVNGGVTHTRVHGGRWDFNGQIGAFSGDVVLSDLYARDNTQGVIQSVTGDIFANNVWQIVDGSGPSTSYDAWDIQAGSGTWNLTNCTVDFTGSSGIKIAAIVSSGRMNLINFRALEPSHAASSFSLFINGGGEIHYDSNSLVDTTAGGLSGGTVTANGALNRYH